MTILLTNDDGIDAPGLVALQQAVQDCLWDDVVIVAPQQQFSGCSHQVTTHQPIQVQQRSDNAYAIAGTPADCVRIALNYLFPDIRFVLSGINSGGNLGADSYVSGTVAAVREAVFHQVPGIAISQYRQGRREIDWEQASRWTGEVLSKLLSRSLPEGAFWNVNLPHPEESLNTPEMVFCPPCRQPLPVAYQVEGETFTYVGRYSERKRDPGGDVEVCFSGQISVTQLQI